MNEVIDIPMNQLLAAARHLGVDVPIQAARVVGNRLELHLYGSGVAACPLSDLQDPGKPSEATATSLFSLTLAELKRLAGERSVNLRGARNKTTVVQRLLGKAGAEEKGA